MKNISPINLSLNRGLKIINKELKTFPSLPGVYKMSNFNDKALYIGKAKNLKNRVTNYTKIENLPSRLVKMVSETTKVEIIVTQTEVEALLLESNLIKKFLPKYNILLKDDKSFPNIFLTKGNGYPQIKKHRGKKKDNGDYYGPFSSAGSVNRTIDAIQKAFLLRNCNDNIFKLRTRPCLQYQIKRCTAPCVGLISKEDYNIQVNQTKMFLSGKSKEVQIKFAKEMQKSSDKLEFENAAVWRNRIRALTSIQSYQDINIKGLNNADVIALYGSENNFAIQVSFMRSGSNYGSFTYFPSQVSDQSREEIITAFINQFYQNKKPPKKIILSHDIIEQNLVVSALSKLVNYKVVIKKPKRGPLSNLIKFSLNSAKENLNRKLSELVSFQNNLCELSNLFNSNFVFNRIEVFDNSHLQGKFAIGTMIVAGSEGLIKSEYRKFNIKKIESKLGGNDYSMMEEVIQRRFKNNMSSNINFPDLILIDGGKGHLNIVHKVLKSLKIKNIVVCAISKGIDRNAGKETFHLKDKESFNLPHNSQIIYFLQRLRDEAHRFAITSHRFKRIKSISLSPIDEIEGIGKMKKQALLKHFGSAKEVARASINNLKNVDGISINVAKRIHDYFQS